MCRKGSCALRSKLFETTFFKKLFSFFKLTVNGIKRLLFLRFAQKFKNFQNHVNKIRELKKRCKSANLSCKYSYRVIKHLLSLRNNFTISFHSFQNLIFLLETFSRFCNYFIIFTVFFSVIQEYTQEPCDILRNTTIARLSEWEMYRVTILFRVYNFRCSRKPSLLPDCSLKEPNFRAKNAFQNEKGSVWPLSSVRCFGDSQTFGFSDFLAGNFVDNFLFKAFFEG